MLLESDSLLMESDGRGNPIVRRIVVVGIAVVVDIAPVRRVGVRRQQPPVVAAQGLQDITQNIQLLIRRVLFRQPVKRASSRLSISPIAVR